MVWPGRQPRYRTRGISCLTNTNPMKGPTLYQRLLGDDFDRLPETLRQFHGDPLGALGKGRFKVERPYSKTLQHLADQYLLPREADSVPVELSVQPDGERERWIRNIGQALLETTQWQEGDELVEEVALSRLRFKVEADENGMTYTQVGRTGLPMPRAILPHVEASVKGTENGFFVKVTV